MAEARSIADFPAIRKVCARLVESCRKMGLLAKASVAIDGSKFKAVNSRGMRACTSPHAGAASTIEIATNTRSL